jgi:alpha/beta hydrolase fold
MIITLMLLFNISHLPAQDLTCANLVNEIYSDSQIKKPNNTDNPPLSYAKRNTPVADVSYTNDFLNNKQCSATTDCKDGSDQLQYEVYYPDINYLNQKLPAVILFHGGGFSDCSNWHRDAMKTYATEFAKRGFIVFNVEYRRGRIEDDKKKYTSASQMLAAYRGFQDGRGALRTIVARELSKSTVYRIDLQNIFLAGESAGGYIALNVGYDTRKMVNQAFPNISDYLGSVTANNYFGDAADDSYTIRGVLNMWGGIYVPLKYADAPENFFSQNPNLPALIAFHGNLDDEVNIGTADIFYSTPPSAYASESLCTGGGTYTLPDNGSRNADIKRLGSESLYETLKKNMGIPCELYIDCDMGHGLDESTSDFGLDGGNALAVTNTDVEKYIVQRAATFFQYIMNSNFPYKLKHTRFVDCENDRYGCNPDETNCDNNATCTSAAIQHFAQISKASEQNSNSLYAVSEFNKNISVHFYQAGVNDIQLFGATGNAIKHIRTNSIEAVLNCGDLASGIYLLRVLCGTKMETTKIFLQP